METKLDKTSLQKYAEFLVEFGKLNLKKSGHNSFQNYDYFELSDFSSQADELLLKNGLVYLGPTRIIGQDGVPCYYSKIVDFYGDKATEAEMEIKESNSSKSETQNAGATLKYYRRYLKSVCVGLVENDEIDSTDTSKLEPKEEPKATEKQVALITQIYDLEKIEKIKKYYNVEKLEDLTVKQASVCLAKKGE